MTTDHIFATLDHMASNESSHIRLNKEDRANLASVKKQMSAKLALSVASISISDAMRYALAQTATKK